MYEDFKITDRWTGEELHCQWQGTMVAIATRHADATDIRFQVNGRPVWIAMPNLAWVEQKRRTGYIITDYLAGAALLLDPSKVGHGDPDGAAVDLKANVGSVGMAGGDGDHGSLPLAMQFFPGPAVGYLEVFVHG